MATGTPRMPKRPRISLAPMPTVSLVYPGKRDLEEILNTAPAAVTTIKKGTRKKRVYFGENLQALANIASDDSIRGHVRLVYIDPPYATQTTFHSRKLVHAYDDVFESSDYIEFLRERLAFLHLMLADDGSIYVHIDEKMLFHVKLIMDEIFGANNYRNCITRKKCNPKNYTRKTFGNVADYILFYTKSDQYVWNRQVEAWTGDRAREYRYVEPETGRLFMKVPVHAPGTRNGETGKLWRGVLPPPGKHWQFPPAKLDELDKKGEIFWSKNGNPRRKVYLDESDGVPVQDIWMDFRDAHNQNICITGYPTEKNIDLLKRIVSASSNPGDIVLDCFAGSGTTLTAADMLDRNWIGIDSSPESLRTMLRRFQSGTEPMGDFVTSERKRKVQESPTLFPEVSDVSGTAEAKRQHIISDFSVLAVTEVAQEAAQILEAGPGPITQPKATTTAA